MDRLLVGGVADEVAWHGIKEDSYFAVDCNELAR